MFLSLLILGVLLVAALVYGFMTRDTGSGRPTVWRGLLVAVLGVGVLGFGTCGGVGSFAGLETLLTGSSYDTGWALVFLVPGVVGLLIAVALAMVIRRMWRSRPTASQDKDPAP